MKRELKTEGQQGPAVKKFKKPIGKTTQDKSTEKKGKFEKKFSKPGSVKNSKIPQKNGITANPGEKPDWQKLKQEKKDLKEKRKVKKLENVYDIAVKAKKIEEKLRRGDCSKKEQSELTTTLFTLLKGQFEKLIFTHDMSRTIQWLIKFSTPDQKQEIFNEVKSKISDLFHSKYAKNCLKKFLKYGNEDIRQEILLGCSGRVVELISNVISAPLLDMAYKNWATDETKCSLKQEFYGGMYKNSKDKNIKTLTDVFASSEDMKKATLSAVKMNLVRVLNKNGASNAIVHAVLKEFLSECTEEDRGELIVMLRDSIVELSETKDGAQAAMTCIWHGTTKDRKSSLKSIKEHVKDLATSEHGHVVFLACLDSIDDTILMKKILFPELISNLKDIVMNEHGKKVILYLVAPRDTHHFHPSFIQQLQQGDGNATSKKPAEIRQKELLEAIHDQLLEAIAAEPVFWLATSSSMAMVTLTIIKACIIYPEGLKKVFEALAELLTTPEVTLEENEVMYSILEHPGLHMMLKKVIQTDKNLSDEEKVVSFGGALVEKLDDAEIKRWLSFNRSCFLLVLLIENEAESVKNSLITKLKKYVSLIKKQKGSGASILLKKVQ